MNDPIVEEVHQIRREFAERRTRRTRGCFVPAEASEGMGRASSGNYDGKQFRGDVAQRASSNLWCRGNLTYASNDTGKLSVFSSYAEWTVLHEADFKDETHATPALVDGQIYLRTKGHL